MVAVVATVSVLRFPWTWYPTVIGHLEQDGEVRRGLLGVTITDLTPDVAEALEVDLEQGALVTGVMAG